MIDLFTYGFGPGRHAVSHNGRTLIKNQADQPHFIEFQQVKPGTTAVQVKRFIARGCRVSRPGPSRPTGDPAC